MTTAAQATRPPTTATAAQQTLDALEAEQHGLTGEISAARRRGDSGAWMRLTQRETDLPDEILAARVAMYRLQLQDAWTVAEACVATEEQTRLELAAASTEVKLFREGFRTRQRTGAEMAELAAEGGALQDTRDAASNAHKVAHHASMAALYEVDALEDAIEAATGERPAEGDGLRRAPRRLAVSYHTYNPADYDPLRGSPGQQNATQVACLIGTIPPRWAAHEMVGRDDVWVVSA